MSIRLVQRLAGGLLILEALYVLAVTVLLTRWSSSFLAFQGEQGSVWPGVLAGAGVALTLLTAAVGLFVGWLDGSRTRRRAAASVLCGAVLLHVAAAVGTLRDGDWGAAALIVIALLGLVAAWLGRSLRLMT